MFRDLNNHYFDLFSDLDACRSVLPPKQYETMANALKKAYDKDLEVILGHKELETARSTFELRFSLRHYVPRRSIFVWNRVAHVLKKECLRRFDAYLASLSNEGAGSTEDANEEDTVEERMPVPVQGDAVPR